MTKSSVRAALILAGTAVAVVASILPAQAATAKGWRISATLPAGHGRVEILGSIAAVSAGDAWTTGFSSTIEGNLSHLEPAIEHWNGKSWRPVSLPSKLAAKWAKDEPFLTPITASSAKNVWAFAGLGAGAVHYLRLKGSHWSIGTVPGTSSSTVEISAARAFSSKNVWAFGTRLKFSGQTLTQTPYAVRYNGTKWSSVKVGGSGEIEAISATSGSSIWAVVDPSDGTTAPTVVHWTPAAGWQPAAVQPALTNAADLSSIVAESNGTVWVGGSTGTKPYAAELKPGGSSWTTATLPAGSGGSNWAISGLAVQANGGLWALSTNEQTSGQPQRMLHRQGTTWSVVKPSFGNHEWLLEQIVTVPHTNSVWGAGTRKQGSTSANGLIAIEGPTPR